MTPRIAPADLFAAATPPAVGLTLAELNSLLGCISLALGIAYLLWKWRREAKKTP